MSDLADCSPGNRSNCKRRADCLAWLSSWPGSLLGASLVANRAVAGRIPFDRSRMFRVQKKESRQLVAGGSMVSVPGCVGLRDTGFQVCKANHTRPARMGKRLLRSHSSLCICSMIGSAFCLGKEKRVGKIWRELPGCGAGRKVR